MFVLVRPLPENCSEKLHKIDGKLVLKMMQFAPKLRARSTVLVYKFGQDFNIKNIL